MHIHFAIITLALHIIGAPAAPIDAPIDTPIDAPINLAGPRLCGTELPNPALLEAIAGLHAIGQRNEPPEDQLSLDANLKPRDNASKLYVNTYFHIVSTSAEPNAITEKMIQAQFNALSVAYINSSIVFLMTNVDRTINNVWAGGDDDIGMKRALRRGSYSALNIYFQASLGSTTLGKCALPQDFGDNPKNGSYAADGCNILASTMPGGSQRGYNLGKTTVHEVGHWFGLLHPFAGYSCDGDGDYIDDTPPQSTETNGCPVKPPKDSCPGKDGVDSIHNFMDYSWDIW